MATKITSIKKIDKITALNHSTGVINLAAGAILTIGGLQYTTDAVKSVTLSGLVGTQRYQIYAVISSGDVILVTSTNENSVGPAGYTSWKLVGSFYTGGLAVPAFGAFVNIRGVPKTDRRIQYLGEIVDQNNTDVRSVSPLTNIFYWERNGQLALYQGGYYHQGSAGSNGSNGYYIKAPGNLVHIDEGVGGGNTPAGGGVAQGDVGGSIYMQGSRNNVATTTGGAFLFNGFGIRGINVVPTSNATDGGIWGASGSGGVIDNMSMNTAFLGMSWAYIPCRVVGFSDTSIEDL